MYQPIENEFIHNYERNCNFFKQIFLKIFCDTKIKILKYFDIFICRYIYRSFKESFKILNRRCDFSNLFKDHDL